MLSYWEKESLLNYHLIVIGGGIVGLSTALSYKQLHSNKRVLVIERGILPTGASTKNAGFACIGSLTEILDDLQTMTEAQVQQLVALRFKGLARLRQRLGDSKAGYAENGSYELIGEQEEACLHQLDYANKLLQPVVNGEAFSICRQPTASFGFNEKVCKHLVVNNFEGELHTGKMMRSLVELCLQNGIEIKTGCEVLEMEERPACVELRVKHGYLNQTVAFSADSVAVCTNSFTASLIEGLDIKPGRGQVLITKPVKGLQFKGIYHFDKGYYYFREIDGRVLIGGGRNFDFETENSTRFEANERIKENLLLKLRELILPGQAFEPDYWWTGIMAFGADKFPVMKQHSPRVFLGVRLGGMGVAIGSELGHQLADMISA